MSTPSRAKVIAVDDDRGIYQISLGCTPEPLKPMLDAHPTVEVVEPLIGWGRWQYSIRIDGASYFTDYDNAEDLETES